MILSPQLKNIVQKPNVKFLKKFLKKPGTRGISKNPQECPQLRLLATVEGVRELAFSFNQIVEYPSYCQRTLIQSLREPDA